MPAPDDPRHIEQLRAVDAASDDFEFALHGGDRPRIEDYLSRVPAASRSRLLSELLRLEIEWQQRVGETIMPQKYLQRFPHEESTVRSALDSLGVPAETSKPTTAAAHDTQPSGSSGTLPKCPGRFGRFELISPLGSGGFGTVYLADDTQLGRRVALKIPRVNDGNRRFLTEARAAAKLQHTHIVTVHDCGELDGWLYIVSAFIDGSDLARAVKTQKLSLRRLVTWIRDAARALAYSHAQGVIHRDIKPGNLLIDSAGQIHVADFGLARRVEDASSLTTDGSLLGTPAYMSPEQAAGRTADVGQASDQYSLAIVLYELLTGRVPFRGNVQQVLQKVANQVPPPPRGYNPSVPAELDAICQRALAHQPQSRYPDLNAFADDLDRWLQLRAGAAGARSSALPELLKKKPLLWGGGAGVAALLLFGCCLMFMGGGADTPHVESPVQPAIVGGGGSGFPLIPTDTGMSNDDPVEVPSANSAQLEQQRLWLTEATTVDRSWDGLLPGAGRVGQPFVATFVEPARQDGSVRLLLSDPQDFATRSVWTGSPQQVDDAAGGAGPQAWVIDLRPEVANPEFPASSVHQIVLGVEGPDALVWKNLEQPLPLAPRAEPIAIPTAEELRVQVEDWTQRGRVWEGTLQEPGQASRYVTLTFTESRDAGQHVRAVLESAESGFHMAPFIGTSDWNPALLLAGRPINLEREARWMVVNYDWAIFGGNWTPYLQLGVGSGEELVGVAGNARVRLKPGAAIADPQPRADQWRNAISPGAVWMGALKLGDEPPARVRVTVAEVRENHSYVRLLAEDMEDPHRFAVYEGAVDVSDEAVDGFALTLRNKVMPPRGLDRRHSLFPLWEDARHSMRLSCDGTTLLCRTHEGENLVLTREEVDAAVPLDRDSFAALWSEVCMRGRTWEGTVHNTAFDVRSTVRMEFSSGPDDLGNVSVLFTVPDMPRIRMQFSGTFNPDSDLGVNGFALKLKKDAAGQGPSILFGAVGSVNLHFRLATDGEHLVGMAGEDGRGWVEFIEIARRGIAN